MNCREARQHWMLYLDSEGDPEMHLQVSDHLGMCPACAEWFARQQRFEQALAERLAAPPCPGTPELWDRVLTGAGVGPRASRRRWLALGGILAAALLLGMAVGLRARRDSHPTPSAEELPRLTVDCHERHLRGLSQVEFRSGDVRAVERYVRHQVSFPVRCPPPGGGTFAVEGAGVCRWAPSPMAYFVGRVEQTSVSVFVLDRACLDTFPQDRARLTRGGGRYRCRQGGYQMVSGVTADTVVVIVGTAPAETLDKLLDACTGLHGGGI